jgi:lipoprotein-releasing system ATP-binding protein
VPSAPAADAAARPFFAAPHGPALVHAEGLRKVYVREGQPLEVLKGVSLTIRAGEILGIVGPSGAGKSTLLHLLGTLDLPTAGTVVINGVDVTKLSNPRVSALRNETIGFVFQFHHLLPEFSALENVMMPALIKGGVARSRLEAEAMRILTEVGLSDRARHRPSEMSGGEQQRVALARALMLRPPILMADEPTGNLDTANSARMHELFFELNRKFGTTMVIVTHNEGLAARVPRVVKMRDGYIVADEYSAASPAPAPDAPPGGGAVPSDVPQAAGAGPAAGAPDTRA